MSLVESVQLINDSWPVDNNIINIAFAATTLRVIVYSDYLRFIHRFC